jgi:hypothetical protein
VCAYNQTFASKFNRDIQRIIDNPLYKNIFPATRLNDNDGYVGNSEEFEIVGNTGSLKTVGVNGALTGNPIDIGIIDDPIKDANEAYSSTFRKRVWDWYTTVFQSRLHNSSQQLITLTRWHEDDLAGRILRSETDWEVLIFPAIKEDFLNPLDTREIGEALWPERHSLKKYWILKQKGRRFLHRCTSKGHFLMPRRVGLHMPSVVLSMWGAAHGTLNITSTSHLTLTVIQSAVQSFNGIMTRFMWYGVSNLKTLTSINCLQR